MAKTTIGGALEQLMVVINRNITYANSSQRGAPPVEELERIARLLGHPSKMCDEHQCGWKAMGGAFENSIYFTHEGLSGVIIHNWPACVDGMNRYELISLLDYNGTPLMFGMAPPNESAIIISLISATNAVLEDHIDRMESERGNKNPA